MALAALPAAVSGLFWLQAMALGALLGAVTVGGAVLVESSKGRGSAPAPSTFARPAPAKGQPVSPVAPSASVAAPAPPPSTAPTRLAVRPIAPLERPAERAEVVAAEVAEPDLVREARLLERARALLGQDPGRALSALQGHELEFPSGALAFERELLRVDALVRLGRRSEASERAAELRARAPASLYQERLERLLGSTFGSAGGAR